MDEELKRAFAIDDAARASFERDEWQRAQRTERSATPTGVDVEKWLASRPKPEPQSRRQQPQPQHTVTLDAATQKLWNSWCDGRIVKIVGPDGVLSDALAKAFSIERERMRQYVADEIKKQLDAEATKLREEISGLRIDSAVSRSILRGEINDIIKKKARA